jgi:hypothetical protein
LGGPQIADLQIEAMALALARSTAWTHFINLSDQDFPVKPRGEIVAQLAVHASTHFVDWFDPFATRLWPNIDQRLGRSVFHWENQLPYLTGYRRPAADFFRYYGGSNHAVIGRAGCELLAQAPEARRIGWLAPPGQAFRLFLRRNPPGQDLAPHLFRAFQEQQGRCHKQHREARGGSTPTAHSPCRNGEGLLPERKNRYGYCWRFQHGSHGRPVRLGRNLRVAEGEVCLVLGKCPVI